MPYRRKRSRSFARPRTSSFKRFRSRSRLRRGSYSRSRGYRSVARRGFSGKLRKFVRRKLRQFRRKRFSGRVRRVLGEEIKPQYLISRRSCNIYAATGRQGSGLNYPGSSTGIDTNYYPSFFDRIDASRIAALNNYVNVSGGSIAAMGNLRVKGRQKLHIKLYNGPQEPYVVPEVYVDMYMCHPRTEHTSNESVSGARVDYPQLAFRYGFKAQELDTDLNLYNDIGTTPYMNTLFTEQFKITRKKSFKLSLRRPERTISFKKYVDFNWAKWGVSDLITHQPTQTVDWLIIIRGGLGAGVVGDNLVGTSQCRVLVDVTNTYSWRPLVQSGKPYALVGHAEFPDVSEGSVQTVSEQANAGVPYVNN